MSFIDAEETRGYRQIEWEVKISGADAGAQGRAERSLQPTRTEWQE